MQSSLGVSAVSFSEDDTGHKGVSSAEEDKLLVHAGLHRLNSWNRAPQLQSVTRNRERS